MTHQWYFRFGTQDAAIYPSHRSESDESRFPFCPDSSSRFSFLSGEFSICQIVETRGKTRKKLCYKDDRRTWACNKHSWTVNSDATKPTFQNPISQVKKQFVSDYFVSCLALQLNIHFPENNWPETIYNTFTKANVKGPSRHVFSLTINLYSLNSPQSPWLV
jgi:hypothetical protein